MTDIASSSGMFAVAQAESLSEIKQPVDKSKSSCFGGAALTCGSGEVVHDLVSQLDAVLVPIEGRVVIQLPAGEFGQGGYRCQVCVLPAAA